MSNGLFLKIESLSESTNLGTLGEISLPINISITGETKVLSFSQYSATISPSTSTYTSVVWSIISGSQYATIDSNGLLNVLDGASDSAVTIRCKSLYSDNVYTDLDISVTYGTVLTSYPLLGYRHREVFDGGKTFCIYDHRSEKSNQDSSSIGYNRNLIGVKGTFDYYDLTTNSGDYNGCGVVSKEDFTALGWTPIPIPTTTRMVKVSFDDTGGNARFGINIFGIDKNNIVTRVYDSGWQTQTTTSEELKNYLVGNYVGFWCMIIVGDRIDVTINEAYVTDLVGRMSIIMA